MVTWFIGQRVVISVMMGPIGPGAPGTPVLKRGEIFDGYVSDGGVEYANIQTDQGEWDAWPINPLTEGLFAEGDFTFEVGGASVAEFQSNVQNAGFSLHSGDAGQVVIEGFGAGALALVPGVRTAFADGFLQEGMILAGITGDGFNRLVVHWEIPTPAASMYRGPAALIIVAPIVIGGVIIAVLLAFSLTLWFINLMVKGTPGSPAQPALDVRDGDPGLDDRVMVRKSDATLVPAGQRCNDPKGCKILAKPAVKGTGLSPWIVAAGIAAVGLVASAALVAFAPRRKE